MGSFNFGTKDFWHTCLPSQNIAADLYTICIQKVHKCSVQYAACIFDVYIKYTNIEFSRSLPGNSKLCETRGKKWTFCCKSLMLKRLTDNMESDEEYEHLPSEFYYPGERLDENSDEASVEASHTTESQEEIEGFLKEQKSANTLKKTTTDMNTVAHYMKDIGKNEKVENLPAAELDHLL